MYNNYLVIQNDKGTVRTLNQADANSIRHAYDVLFLYRFKPGTWSTLIREGGRPRGMMIPNLLRSIDWKVINSNDSFMSSEWTGWWIFRGKDLDALFWALRNMRNLSPQLRAIQIPDVSYNPWAGGAAQKAKIPGIELDKYLETKLVIGKPKTVPAFVDVTSNPDQNTVTIAIGDDYDSGEFTFILMDPEDKGNKVQDRSTEPVKAGVAVFTTNLPVGTDYIQVFFHPGGAMKYTSETPGIGELLRINSDGTWQYVIDTEQEEGQNDSSH